MHQESVEWSMCIITGVTSFNILVYYFMCVYQFLIRKTFKLFVSMNFSRSQHIYIILMNFLLWMLCITLSIQLCNILIISIHFF
jgi:hypothetical protein